MNGYTAADLLNAFSRLGLSAGDVVLVQTALMDLGFSKDCKTSDIPAEIYRAVRETVGTPGTVCAQSFTFEPARGAVYRRDSREMITGAFAKYLFDLPGTVRSRHPLQSILANGGKAENLCGSDTVSGYSVRGPYGLLLENDAKLLMIGRKNVETGGFAHYAEEQAQVPYREWKTFSVRYGTDGGIEERKYGMYVRSEKYDAQIDLSKLCSDLEKRGIVRSCRVGAGDVRIAKCREVANELRKFLEADPWIMVKNHGEKIAGNGEHMSDGSQNKSH